ncbi:MAG: diacylglycerol kinase family protein [Polyangiaceae bacterium]
MSPKILVIANARARGLATDPSRLASLDRVTRGRAKLAVTERVSEVGGALDAFLSAEGALDLLVVAGGDGASMSAASALAPRIRAGLPPPIVGLLPFGTVGTVARNFGPRVRGLGAPGDSLALLERWLEAPDAIRWTERPIVRVREVPAEGPEIERHGFIFGTGLVARFFEAYEAGGANGIPLAARIVARIFLESFTGGPLARRILTPMPAALEVDGGPHLAGRYSLLCCSVVPDLGLRMRVNYRAGERLDRLHLVASSLPPTALGPRMPLVMMGRSIGGRDHVDALVEEFSLRFDGEGPYVLDGDMFRAREVRVSAGATLRIIGA